MYRVYLYAIVLSIVSMFANVVYAGPMDHFNEIQRIRQEKRVLSEYITQLTTRSTNPVTIEQSRRIIDTVYTYAAKHKADPLLVLAMMRTESTFFAKAKSAYGAKGLLQVVPRFHQNKLQGRDPLSIHTNVDVGIQILNEYLASNKQQLPKALNKYSGGARNYYAKIATYHKEMSRHLVQTAFINQHPITVVHSITDPTIPPIDNSFNIAEFLNN